MSSETNTRTLSYAQALNEATVQEMERDEEIFVFGLGVDDPKGMYGTTADLHTRFGADRNFDTPLSEDAMTGHLLVVDNAWTNCGASTEIIVQVIEQIQISDLPLKVHRLGFAPVPCPTTKPLENLFYPNATTIAAAAYRLLRGDDGWTPEIVAAREITEFRGPF